VRALPGGDLLERSVSAAKPELGRPLMPIASRRRDAGRDPICHAART
jgi:hypothetical protein